MNRVGRGLVHRESKFCFIYKFRARFGVIAKKIGCRFGLDISKIFGRSVGFLLKTSIAASAVNVISRLPKSRRRFINICQTGLFAKNNGNLSQGASLKLGAESVLTPDSGPHSTSLLGNPNDHRARNGKTLFCFALSTPSDMGSGFQSRYGLGWCVY